MSTDLCAMRTVTVVLGASPEPTRYAYLAVGRLLEKGYRVIPIGKRTGSLHGLPILKDLDPTEKVDTVTLYLDPGNQLEWEERILAWRPRRIIFNPGTEHADLAFKARALGIEVVEGCTLVMLSVGTY